MKYTNANLTRWLQAANAALAENDVECVVTSREGRAEVRTPAGAIVTAWASGKVSAGGPTVPRQDLLSALSAADLIVGFTATLMTGGMLLKMPEVEAVGQRPSVAHKPALAVPTTDHEVLAEIHADTPLNKARRAFSSWSAKIEQAGSQRRPLDPIDWRRMEFEAVAEIAAALDLAG